MTTDSSILKDCPFCGQPAQVEKLRSGEYWASCSACLNGSKVHPVQQDAIDDWNRRPPGPKNTTPSYVFEELLAAVHAHDGQEKHAGEISEHGDEGEEFDIIRRPLGEIYSDGCGGTNIGRIVRTYRVDEDTDEEVWSSKVEWKVGVAAG
jgi:Lar family restriction alleviation protein